MILIGSMGAGKTSAGPRLAEKLRVPFIDLDDIVVAKAAMSVREIFAAEGERGFRVREKEALGEAIASGPAVIACGGGVVLDPENVAALRRAGRVVLLDVDATTSARRLKGTADRPLLAHVDMEQRLAELHDQRNRAYQGAAHVVVDARGTVADTVEAILKELA